MISTLVPQLLTFVSLLALSNIPPATSSVIKTSTSQVPYRLGSRPTPTIAIPTALPRLRAVKSGSVPGMFAGKIKPISYNPKKLSTSFPTIAEPEPSKKTAHHQTQIRQKIPSLPSPPKLKAAAEFPEIPKMIAPRSRRTIRTTKSEKLPIITVRPFGFDSHKRKEDDGKK